MDSKELTKALIAALPDTLEELTARLRQAVADPLVDPTDIPDDVRNMLLHSGRSDFLLTIDNVNADGSISCQIVPTPRATGYEQPLRFFIESGKSPTIQRQGADSPTSAINPSAAQDYAPARNNAQSTVGALQEATETPRVQSAPATLPWCGCRGPWCEGREDRNGKVKCLGYQIDSDGMAGVGACATCGAPGSELAKERIAFWEKIADLENAVANREARLKASEREIERMRGAIANARSRIAQHWPDGPVRGSVIAFLDQAAYGRASLLREPVPVASNAPPGIPNKPAGMA